MIQSLSLRSFLYGTFCSIPFYVVLLYNLSQYKKRKEISSLLSNSKLGTIFEIILVSCAQYLPIGFLNNSWGKLMSTGANYFGLLLFTPYFLLIFCYFFRVNPLEQIDLIAPAYPLALVFVKLACFTIGCCRGFECSWGMYNYRFETTEFPSQLLESLVALLLFFFLLYWKRHATTGTLFPLYTILYSFHRFFTEFTRCEEDVLFFLNTYQLICLVGIVIGFVEYFFALECKNEIKKIFSKKLYQFNFKK